MNSERSSFGLALVGRAFGAGIASSMISKATSGPSTSSVSSACGCSSPNQPAIILRAELQRRAAAGMQEGRAAGDDLHRVEIDAERGEQGERVAPWRRRHRPLPPPLQCRPAPLALGQAAPQRRRRDALIVLAVAEEDLADLEQGDILEAAPRIALGRRREAGNEARAHVGEIGRDRIGERRAPACRRRTVPPAAWTMNDQVTASLEAEAASVRLASRVRFCSSVSTGFGTPASSRGSGVDRHAVEPGDAHDLLDDVGLAVDVGAPVRHDDAPSFDLEAERREDR